MSIEALKQARQIIWRYRHETPVGNQPYWIAHEADEAIERIDQALAKQEQGEPDELTIAYMSGLHRGKDFAQQRTWVELTDEEIDAIYWQHENHCGEYEVSIYPYERAIEAKLRSKNERL